MTSLDKRLNVFRPDLADIALKGQCDAEHFVEPTLAHCIAPVTAVFRTPAADAMQTSQVLFGENLKVFERKNGWAWVQVIRDGYVGYVAEPVLAEGLMEATHHIATRSAHLYPEANLKTQPARAIPMNAQIKVIATSGDYASLSSQDFVFAAHVSSKSQQDFVVVAEQFLHTPYLWGGKTVWGIDCSGLVQTALHACGQTCPRDSDMQEHGLGHEVTHDKRKRGDLVFWKGHVGIMQNETTLLHANGHHMLVVSEPLTTAITRIAAKGSEITAVKRL
jgi:cell wall-associated NlpC family hydrolase